MPEGHIIHRLARELRSTLGGAPVAATSPQGRFAQSAALIDGLPLHRSDAYGKYLFATFGAGGPILHVHLGLIGKLRRIDPASFPSPTTRLRLEGDDVAWSLTGPSRCELVTPDERASIIERIGPDPLRRDADPTLFVRGLARTSRTIGAVLLDQGVIAGLGNIFRAEILFLVGVRPDRPANALSAEEVEAIWAESVRLLKIGLRTGRIITTDPDEIGRPRSRMTRDDSLYVYHRNHCRRCGSEIRTFEMGGRPIQYCPVCQPR